MRPAAPTHETHDASGTGRSRDDDDDGERQGPMGGGWRASLAALTHPSSGRQLRLLVAFVLLHNFKPSEPFLVEWLTTTDGGAPGMSTRDVYARLFPVFTYSRVPSLAAIALASGAFGPKASVVLGAACALTTVVITASCRRSFAALAASQATVALSFASHHALLGLVFSTVDPATHPAAAHATKAATMASCALSALCGQAMRSWMNAPLFGLFVTSAIAQAAAVVAAIALDAGNPATSTRRRARRSDPGVPTFRPRLRPRPRAPVPGGAWKLSGGWWKLLTSGPAVWAWSAWSVGCAPAHSFAATNWQTLVPRRRGPGMNGWFSATQYACAGAAAMIAGDLAYRDDRVDGHSGFALTSTPFIASGALAVASVAAGRRDLAAALALLVFNCVFEATSCVCAANVGRHARGAAEEEEEEEEGAEEEEEEEEVWAENEEESAESYARLGSSREEEARIDSGLDRPRLDAFGGRVTTLFVMISAAGYLVEAVLIRLCGWAGRGGLGSRDRFLVHAAWLALVGCGLVALHLRSNRRPDEGDYVALEDGDV